MITFVFERSHFLYKYWLNFPARWAFPQGYSQHENWLCLTNDKDGDGEKEKILKIQATVSWNRNSEKHHFCHIPFIHS